MSIGKVVLLCYASPALSFIGLGKNRISYTYDSAGNRTGRAPEQQVTALSQGQRVTNQQVLFTRPNPKFTEHDTPVCRVVQEGRQRAAGRFWLTERTDMPWRGVYAGSVCAANFGFEHVEPELTRAKQDKQNGGLDLRNHYTITR